MLGISKVLILLGVDMSDPYAQDDIVVSELHIPKGKKIILR
jgi:cytochrome c oxidase subunit 2